MLTFAKKTALAGAVVCVALAASAAAAEAPRGQTIVSEGPGGRTDLTRWTLHRDPANRGMTRGWARGGFGGAPVSVPNVVQPLPYSGPAAQAGYEGSVAWYRTTFHAPTAGMYALRFESANFQANVWVDGHSLGSHRGSYLPFEPRVQVAAGTHTLVVRVDWRDPAAQSRIGFHRTWFNWGGLDGEVSVRAIGASELSNPALQTALSPGSVVCVRAPCPDIPAVQSATVRVSVQVRNDGASGRAILPTGSLVRGSQTIPLSFPEQHLAHGQMATVSTSVNVPEPALWSPASPSLYQLTLTVGQESSYSARIGLRQLTWNGGHMYLNGQRLRVHGATIQEDALGHGDALTPGDESAIVSELRAIGANAVRAQHPLDPALLERLDAAGILVWQGIGPVEGAGNWYSNTPALLADAENQARTAAIADQLHPSILAWNLVDEVAENGRNGAEVSYVQSLTRWLHAHDPTRMVAVDIWGDHPPTRPGALYRGVDAIAETDYSGWYDNPHNSPTAVSAEIARRLGAMQRTFAGKVLVISEFGAESNGLNSGGSPGSYSFQASLLARHIRAYAADPELSGMFVYLLRDYPLVPTFEGGSIHGELPRLRLIEGLNQKGLFTYGGRPKQAVGAVAGAYRALGSG
jgi:Glycosyl hydrolases family 2, TIM barrel domain/Glycosyl hydrolases family 2/Glycosyl hydrolases family 2, sugar binding domain